MHTPSTRIRSALAYGRGEEYDPGGPIAPDLAEALSLVETARPVIGEDGPYERARQHRGECRKRSLRVGLSQLGTIGDGGHEPCLGERHASPPGIGESGDGENHLPAADEPMRIAATPPLLVVPPGADA